MCTYSCISLSLSPYIYIYIYICTYTGKERDIQIGTYTHTHVYMYMPSGREGGIHTPVAGGGKQRRDRLARSIPSQLEPCALDSLSCFLPSSRPPSQTPRQRCAIHTHTHTHIYIYIYICMYIYIYICIHV